MKAVVIALALSSTLVPSASGATRTWIAKHAGVWSDPANWDSGVPLAGDDVVLGNSGSTNDLPSGLQVHSIRMLNGTISGNEIILGSGGLDETTQFVSSVAANQVMFSKITLGASQTWIDRGSRPGRSYIGPTDLNGFTLTLASTHLIIQSISGGAGAIVIDSGSDAIETSTFTGPITLNGGFLTLFGGTLGSLDVKPGAQIAIDGTTTSGSLTFRSASGQPTTLAVYALRTLHVAGSVSLQNAVLALAINAIGPPVNTPFLLIDNDGGDPAAGTFLGLPEGAIINDGHGQSFRISYIGGDGNDVTLTRLAFPAADTRTSIAAGGGAFVATVNVTQGSVGFYDGGALLGTAPLDANGRASLAMPALPAGKHVITAAYLGTPSLATSQDSMTINVAGRPRVARPTSAATLRIWIGAAGPAWSNPANWNGGVPMDGDDVVFPANGVFRSVINDLPAGLQLHSLTIEDIYDIGGNELSLGTGGLHNAAPSGKLEFENRLGAVALSSSQEWSSRQSAMRTHVGPLNVNGHTLTLSMAELWIHRLTGDGAVLVNDGLNMVLGSTFDGSITVDGGLLDLSGTAGVVQVRGGTSELFAASVRDLTVAGLGGLVVNGESTAGNLSFAGGHFAPTAAGATLHVTGRVALDNAVLSTGFLGPAATGTTFVVIDNQSHDPIGGTFMGLPEGAIVTNNGDPSTFAKYRLSYAGGDGNDVTLTSIPASNSATSLTATPTLLTATVVGIVPPFGHGVPTGTVSFFDGTTLLGTAPLDFGGRAILSVRLAGTHTIRAVYPGSDVFAASEATATLTTRIRAVR